MVKAYTAANVILPLRDYSKAMVISGTLAPRCRGKETKEVM